MTDFQNLIDSDLPARARQAFQGSYDKHAEAAEALAGAQAALDRAQSDRAALVAKAGAGATIAPGAVQGAELKIREAAHDLAFRRDMLEHLAAAKSAAEQALMDSQKQLPPGATSGH